MRRVTSVDTIRHLTMAEEALVQAIGLTCPCGAVPTHDATMRYQLGAVRYTSGLKLCRRCAGLKEGKA